MSHDIQCSLVYEVTVENLVISKQKGLSLELDHAGILTPDCLLKEL